MQETRTTCAVEATNGALSAGFASNTNLFTFIDYISDKDLMYSIRLRTMFQRCTVVKRKRASSKADSEYIRKASLLLDAGTLTVDEFLENIAQMKSQKIIQFTKHTVSDDSDSDEDNSSACSVQSASSQLTHSSQSSQSSVLCVMCEKENRNVVFLPCAHQVICSLCCVEKLQKNDAKCNMCHSHIVSHIVVRN